MPAKPATARKRATARRKKPVHPAKRVKIPKGGPVHARLAGKLMLHVAAHLDTHGDTVRSRKDAAILRETHKGCPTCKGNGQIFTKGKDGSFTGSKPCPAKPTTQKVSKWAVYKASRFGADKSTGLVGWACPCGKKEKPRYRDAREATKALRTHERNKHGGKSVGGAWYAQTTEAAVQQTQQRQPAVSKVVTDSGMSDEQWIKQNKGTPVATAIAKGLCWKCSGNGKLHAVFGNEQLLVVCPECTGSGKAQKQAA